MASQQTAIVVFNEQEARALTERIREATNNLAALLREAHEHEAWRALGYTSWNAYVDAEFNISESRSYRLLAAARLEEAVSTAVRSPVMLREGTVRAVVHHDDAVAEQARMYVDAGEKPQRAAEMAVDDVRKALPAPAHRARRGPPSLASYLTSMNAASTAIDIAFETAGDDALAYMAGQDRQQFERTVQHVYEWAEMWLGLLSAQPATTDRVVSDWGA